MKITISILLDTLFYLMVFFIIFFVILSYFLPNAVSISLSCCLSALVTLLVFYKLQKNRTTFLLNKTNEKLYNDCVTELNFYTQTEQAQFMKKVLTNLGYVLEQQKNALILKDKNAVLFMFFGFDPVRKTDVVKVYNSINKTQTAYILSESFSQEITEFSNRFNDKIVLANGRTLFDFLLKNENLPPEKYALLQSKTKKQHLSELLLKKHAKRFFYFGIIFLFTSYFTPIKTYYIIFGCLFLIFSAIIKLFGKEPLAK